MGEMTHNPDIYSEKSFQEQAGQVLQKLGYILLAPKEALKQRNGRGNVLLRDILRAKLHELNSFEYGGVKSKFVASNIERAMDELDVPIGEAGGLVKASEHIYDALVLGRDMPEKLPDGTTKYFNVRYIDWEDVENNVFHVVREFFVESLTGGENAKPDLVLFVNGIAFGVIECKTPLEGLETGISQMIRNQKPEYIPQLFKFAQIAVATNKNSASYATTGTPKRFWSTWKEERTQWLNEKLAYCVVDRLPTEQDKVLVSLFEPERLLLLVRYFILYDANMKKIARYQQYFAIEEIIKTVNTADSDGNRQSGVVWHTQGSGKSLTMAILAKYLLEQIKGSKIVVVTDRTELNRQIEQTFNYARLKPVRATSGKNLVQLLHEDKSNIIMAIINKFSAAEGSKVKVESRDIFVLVDESHRTNYGNLATKMRTVFPNACYIGFTGTPLINKQKTAQRFGENYIHTYSIKDGVDDGAIVPLIYEGRFVEQKIDEENIGLWFEQITKRLPEKQIEDLKSRWSRLRRLASTDARIRRIALDIYNHFMNGFKDTGFKAMLACNFKRDAVRYLECFEEMGDINAAVVISSPDTREGHKDIEEEKTDDKVIVFWKRMMTRYGNAKVYEESVRNQFLGGDVDILIVCGKLLTGFDAPLTQVIYIDKELKGHGLLQAMARANRLSEGKDYGLIVDYRGLISKLDETIEVYSGAGLENFDAGELRGAVIDVLSCVGKVREVHSLLLDVFGELRDGKDSEELEVYLADDDLRKEFYAALCDFGKALTIALNSERVYEALSKDEIEKYKQAFNFFSKIRRSVKIRYADAIDNKEYEPQMQSLLDRHLNIVGLRQITNPVDVLDKEELERELEELGSLRAKADAIHSAMTKSISELRDENPLFYDSFSKRVKEVLEEYKNRIINETDYLHKMRSILDDYRKGDHGIVYPEKIKGDVHAQAFFGVISAVFSDTIDLASHMDIIADITLAITKIIEQNSHVDWQYNRDIHNRIAQDIDDLFFEYEKQGFLVDFDSIDKITENVKTVALRNFR